MSSIRMAAVLLDVGGTLWPEIWPADDERNSRLGAALGFPAENVMRMFIQRLESSASFESAASYAAPGAPWAIGSAIEESARELGCHLDANSVLAVRRAMALPAAGRIDPLPYARELLATIKGLGLKCAVLSNTVWRDAEIYRQDFEDFSLSQFIDEIITSIDSGYRKPDQRAFEAAAFALGCRANACVMVGNSEANDILPARELGMRTIRVAIEERRPAASSAHAIAGSLKEVSEILCTWA
jgi:FMN phosphatase YigB (HAD superfamily)